MGVGTPENMLEAVRLGVDMFDCVLPTRNGRNATLFTKNGKLHIRGASFADEFTPVRSRVYMLYVQQLQPCIPPAPCEGQ